MIVVAGMHRSGTSAIAGLLHALDLDVGDPAGLYAADGWNERGYFEQLDLLDLNSEIVTGLPRTGGALTTWLGQARYLGMPARSKLAARARRRSARMRELAGKYRGRLVKDPRFCLTLPDWIALDAVESLVVCVRHPGEVADSLWRRQRIPRAAGLRFWNYHMAALLDAIADVPVLFLDYAALLADGARELRRLHEFLGLKLDLEECMRRRTRALSADLRHCQTTSRALPARTARLYAALRARCV